jgi:uncharacterized protein (DUF433 family)
VIGARVSLDSIAHGFNRGQSPEAIQEDFPTLTRAQVYGAIAFYLDNQDEIDEYLAASAREFEAGAIPLAEENPALWARLQGVKARMGEPQHSSASRPMRTCASRL